MIGGGASAAKERSANNYTCAGNGRRHHHFSVPWCQKHVSHHEVRMPGGRVTEVKLLMLISTSAALSSSVLALKPPIVSGLIVASRSGRPSTQQRCVADEC